MKKHIKNYLKGSDGIVEDVFICENCAAVAVDIHHITYKSAGGSDNYDNLIALCRDCHDEAHRGELTKEQLYEIIAGRD